MCPLLKQMLNYYCLIVLNYAVNLLFIFNCKDCISAKEPQKPFLWNKPASINCILWYVLRVRCVLTLVVKLAPKSTEVKESSVIKVYFKDREELGRAPQPIACGHMDGLH